MANDLNLRKAFSQGFVITGLFITTYITLFFLRKIYYINTHLFPTLRREKIVNYLNYQKANIPEREKCTDVLINHMYDKKNQIKIYWHPNEYEKGE